MGYWGTSPYSNDAGADFFYGALGMTSHHVHIAFDAVVNKGQPFGPETYAALWLFSKIGKNYVYNIDFLDADLEMAKELLDKHATEWANEFGDRLAAESVFRYLQEIRADLEGEEPPGLIEHLEIKSSDE